MTAQFVDAFGCPGEVLGLFLRGLLQGALQDGVTRCQCLSLIQRLCANLAGMINTHQCRRMFFLGLIQRCFGQVRIRMCPRAMCLTE